MSPINMEKLKKQMSVYRIFAVALTAVILVFAAVVFFSQAFEKSHLVRARIVEVLQIQDDQGLIYQNFLVSLDHSPQVQVRVPLNLPEVSGLGAGDYMYLQEVMSGEDSVEYRYASTDRSFEFAIILILFIVVVFVVVGIRPVNSVYPALVFLFLLITGVFTLSTEVRYVFLSILGFMTIISLIGFLWFYQDLSLGLLVSLIVSFSLLFSMILYTLLINFTQTTEMISFVDLFSDQSLVYDYDKARLLASMIFVYGMLLNLISNIVGSAKEYLKTHKKASRFSLIKFNVESVQQKIAELLNLVFFLALGLNFLGLVSEDYAPYKFVWNSSFFLGVVIDGVVVAVSLIVAGYVTSLLTAIYLHQKVKPETAKR